MPITEDVDEVDEAGDKPQLADIVTNASSDNPETQLAAVTSARYPPPPPAMNVNNECCD